MELTISDIVKVTDLQKNHSMFKAELSLQILNLTEQSEVSIQWQPTSQCFISTLKEQTHTFNEDDPLACVDIKYKIKVQLKKITPTVVEVRYNSARLLPSQALLFLAPGQTLRSVELLPGQVPGTRATVASKPMFSFAATSTVEASKSNLVSEQESPNSTCVYIDVKMKLV